MRSLGQELLYRPATFSSFYGFIFASVLQVFYNTARNLPFLLKKTIQFLSHWQARLQTATPLFIANRSFLAPRVRKKNKRPL